MVRERLCKGCIGSMGPCLRGFQGFPSEAPWGCWGCGLGFRGKEDALTGTRSEEAPLPRRRGKRRSTHCS